MKYKILYGVKMSISESDKIMKKIDNARIAMNTLTEKERTEVVYKLLNNLPTSLNI